MCVLIVYILKVLDWLLNFHLKVMQIYLAFLDEVGYKGKVKHHSNVKNIQIGSQEFLSYSFLPQKACIILGLLKAKTSLF